MSQKPSLITVAEVQAAKAETETAIRKALDDFMVMTGLPIEAVRVDFTTFSTLTWSRPVVARVEIDVKV